MVIVILAPLFSLIQTNMILYMYLAFVTIAPGLFDQIFKHPSLIILDLGHVLVTSQIQPFLKDINCHMHRHTHAQGNSFVALVPARFGNSVSI